MSFLPNPYRLGMGTRTIIYILYIREINREEEDRYKEPAHFFVWLREKRSHAVKSTISIAISVPCLAQ